LLLRLLLILPLLLASSPLARAQEKSLSDRLTPLVRAHKGRVAIAVKHLGSGETFILDADEAMSTASLIKFAILLELYQQAAEGKLKLSDMVTLREADKVRGSGILTYHFSEGASFSLRDAARLMMVYSDNTATNLVLDRTGIGPVNERMAAWGCPNTRVHAKVFRRDTSIDLERSKKYGLGSTTARETVQLLEKVHRHEIINADACKAMLEHMKKCEDKDKLKKFLPASVVVAHKTGSVDDVKTDAGIMYFPGGPVAICVLTNQNEDKRYVPENAGGVLIGRVAEQVHAYFAVKEPSKK
jgi:D-alanyl-D-alanine carboxypeptidase (penicillin-binding protein 5/6)/beta-lactamase class A